jgi:hypothetical protein
MKIHALFLYKEFAQASHYQVVVALETTDNQIDFNRLIIKHMPSKNQIEEEEEKTFEFEFRQICEVVFRDNVKYDEVKKFSISFTEKKDGKIESFAITLRKSGSCDFYYCLAKVATYERQKEVEH